MGDHAVVLFVREKSKEFSITARIVFGARLDEVIQQMAELGFTHTFLAKGLEKRQAEERRDLARAEYIARGYAYQTREQLS